MSSSDADPSHISVLLSEIVEMVEPQPDDVVVDATLGLGGHSKALLERQPELRLVGLDQDADAIKIAKETLKPYGDRVTVIQTNFVDIGDAISGLGVREVNAVIADLGVSS